MRADSTAWGPGWAARPPPPPSPAACGEGEGAHGEAGATRGENEVEPPVAGLLLDPRPDPALDRVCVIRHDVAAHDAVLKAILGVPGEGTLDRGPAAILAACRCRSADHEHAHAGDERGDGDLALAGRVVSRVPATAPVEHLSVHSSSLPGGWSAADVTVAMRVTMRVTVVVAVHRARATARRRSASRGCLCAHGRVIRCEKGGVDA